MKKKTLLDRLKESIERFEEGLSELLQPSAIPIPVPIKKQQKRR
jgi:hypothetical protein